MGRGSIFSRRRAHTDVPSSASRKQSVEKAQTQATPPLAIDQIGAAPRGETQFADTPDKLTSQISLFMAEFGDHIAVIKDEELYEVHLSRRNKLFIIHISLPATFPIARPVLHVPNVAHELICEDGEVRDLSYLRDWNCHKGSTLPGLVRAVLRDFKDTKPIVVSSHEELPAAREKISELIKQRNANIAAEGAKRRRDERLREEEAARQRAEAEEVARLRRVRADQAKQDEEKRQKEALLRRMRSASVPGSSKPLSFPRRVSVADTGVTTIPVIVCGGSPANSPVKPTLAIPRDASPIKFDGEDKQNSTSASSASV